MKYGLTLPIFDRLADPGLLADLAAEAEAEGWDGVFVWDHVYYREPVEAATDPWISLAAMALNTSVVRLGPMVTPLARRRPQIVARQLAALDQLAEGRLVLGTGLGLDSSGGEFKRFGDTSDVGERAAAYDEALGLLRELLSGNPVDHEGRHFTAKNVRFLPRPVQPRLPIWVATRWPNRRPLVRAAAQDGVFIIDLDGTDDLRTACAHLESLRSDASGPLDVVVQAAPGTDPRPWEEAGATWWLAAFDPFSVSPEIVQAAIKERPGA